jgi:hypothetical protein
MRLPRNQLQWFLFWVEIEKEEMMRTAELLTAMATWLESPHNEALCLAEDDEECLKIVAESLVLAAALLKTAATEVDAIEPAEPSVITTESIQDLANLATAFDASGDLELKKQASVLDELLLSIAAPPNAYAERKDLQDNRLIALKKKYDDPRKELHEANLIGQSERAIDKSMMTKKLKLNEYPLSSRYCPVHAGVPIARIGEHLYQCELDKATYNFETGYQMENGDWVPGGDVALQTQNVSVPSHALFDTRESRLQTNR